MNEINLMNGMGLMFLIGNSRDCAHEGLMELERLDRDRWIEIIDYSLVDKDEEGQAWIRAEGGAAETVSLTVGGSMTAALIGGLFGPIGVAADATVGAVTGVVALPLPLAEKQFWNEITKEIRTRLKPGNSALAVILEERYIEHAAVELEGLGRIFRIQFSQSQWDAARRIFLNRIRDRADALEAEINNLTAKTDDAGGDEKLKLELAVKRMQLDAERRKLAARLKAICSVLDANLCKMKKRIEGAETTAKVGIELSISETERAIDNCSDTLAVLILDQMDSLRQRAEKLEARTGKTSKSGKAVIEGELREVEVRMKEGRAELIIALLTWALNEQQRIDSLCPLGTLGKARLNHEADSQTKKLQETHARLMADIWCLERKKGRMYHELGHRLRMSYRALSQSIEKARLEYEGQSPPAPARVA